MRISRRATLPADVEEAFAVIATDEFQQEKVAGRGVDASAGVAEQPGGTVAIRSERTLPTRGMPGPFVAAVGDTLTISERQTWSPARADGARTADLELEIRGAPVRLRGTVGLHSDEGGCVLTVDGELSCSLPLVGRKVEAAARRPVEAAFDQEVRLLVARLG